MKHIIRISILPFLTGTALGKYCYESGQKWIDVGTEPVIAEAIERVCSTKRLAGEYPKHETIRTCENVAGHSFYVSIQHLDSEGGLDPWLLSQRTCHDLLKKVYQECPEKGGSMILTAGTGENNPWVNADVRVDPENSCCDC